MSPLLWLAITNNLPIVDLWLSVLTTSDPLSVVKITSSIFRSLEIKRWMSCSCCKILKNKKLQFKCLELKAHQKLFFYRHSVQNRLNRIISMPKSSSLVYFWDKIWGLCTCSDFHASSGIQT